MNELVLVLRAADLAAQWHVHQRRKGAAGEPYINHLLEVSNLATQATNGSEPNVTIAALLHDAVEDQDVTAKTIASEFGQDIANIVLEVTDDHAEVVEIPVERLGVLGGLQHHMSKSLHLGRLAGWALHRVDAVLRVRILHSPQRKASLPLDRNAD